MQEQANLFHRIVRDPLFFIVSLFSMALYSAYFVSERVSFWL